MSLELPQEEPKPERPGQRIIRIPFDMMGYILNVNAPTFIRPGCAPEGGYNVKEEELWMVRCDNWPKDAVVVECYIDHYEQTLLVKIEAPEFKRDPCGCHLANYDLQYSRVRVREMTDGECLDAANLKSEKSRASHLYELTQKLEQTLGKLTVAIAKKETSAEQLLELALSGFEPTVRKMYEEALAGRPMLVRATVPPATAYWKAEQ